MRRIVLLALVAACGHKAATPAAPDRDLTMPSEAPPDHDDAAAPPPRVTDPAGAAVSAAPAAPAPGPAVPPLAGDGPDAFVGDAGGLIEVAPSGAHQAIAPAPLAWCAVDARAEVVWFVADGWLQAFDLRDRRVRKVVGADVEHDEVAVDWGDQRLGAESKVDFQVAIALRMKQPPVVSSELGCDGDQAVYCYEEDGTTLKPEIAERQRAIDALRLPDPAYVQALAERGAGRSLWTPPPMPPVAPRPPKIDRKACEEDRARCGALVAIPASALWLVTTANSRGDFYHETRELWDPATGEFVALDKGALARSKKPRLGDTDYGGLRIAPSGLLSIDGAVFGPSRVVYAPRGDGAISCGFAGGGWRMPGVRG
jgi:hypothetical protein